MEKPVFPRSSAPSRTLSRDCETGAASDLRLACATLLPRMSRDFSQPAPLSTSRTRRGALEPQIFLVGPAWIVASCFAAVGVAVVVSLSELGLIAVSMVGCWRFKVVSVGWDLGTTVAGAVLVGVFLRLHSLLLRLTGTPVVALAVVSVVGLGCVTAVAKKVRLV